MNNKQEKIPGGWATTLLKNVATRIGDGLHTTPKYTKNEEYFFINGNNLSEGSISFSDKTKTINQSEYIKRKQALDGNAVLLSINGTIGNVAYYNNEKVVLGKSAAYIICSSKINKNFLFYFLHTSRACYFFESELSGSTIKNLSLKSIRNTNLLLPPLPEQNRIVAVLETWDQYLEKLEKKIRVKKNIKKWLMQQLLTGETRLPGFSGEWKEAKLGEIGAFTKGKGVTKKELSEEGNSVIRYGELYTKHNIRISTIYSFISDQVAKTSKQIQTGDIVFAGSGETIDEIGKSAVYLEKSKCYVGGDTLILSPDKQDNLYLAYLLNYQTARRELRKLGQGQSVVHLYTKDLSKLKILLPPLQEQSAIAEILTTADEEIMTLENKRDIIVEQKKYLLNNLITGNIRTSETILTN